MLFRPTSMPYSLNLIPQCYAKEKEINCGCGSMHANLTFEFQNCKVKFAQHFSGRYYVLIQVFCFCSTNFTWFNSIIKYKNLSTNKYVWFNKTFSLYLTKLFYRKNNGYLHTTIHIHTTHTIHTETRIF